MLKKYSYTVSVLLSLTLLTGCSVKYYELPSAESSQSSQPVDTNLKTDELVLPKSSSSIIIQNQPLIMDDNNPSKIELPIKISSSKFFRVYAKQGNHNLVEREIVGQNESLMYWQLFDSTTPVYFQLSDIQTSQILFERTYYLN
ncbi:hypothetical protein R4Y45_01390 [Holzapfeliella sp. He02]|uniref:Lipoprotein n=1 Tax=Holzapfeliella saturejae TaxID=3082953 RepID=A0ABU8SGT3_9LACO